MKGAVTFAFMRLCAERRCAPVLLNKNLGLDKHGRRHASRKMKTPKLEKMGAGLAKTVQRRTDNRVLRSLYNAHPFPGLRRGVCAATAGCGDSPARNVLAELLLLGVPFLGLL